MFILLLIISRIHVVQIRMKTLSIVEYFDVVGNREANLIMGRPNLFVDQFTAFAVIAARIIRPS